MKHSFFAVAVLVLAACTQTIEQPVFERKLITIRAYQEGGAETKTTLFDGGTQVYWEPNDEIKVFFRGYGNKFISQNTGHSAVADFSGTMDILVGMNEGASGDNSLWGLYPYMADATSDGTSVTTRLLEYQIGKEGSFARNTLITLARSYSHELTFYNVVGGVRFSLSQEGITSVTLEGNNGEDLAGTIKMEFSGDVPSITEVTQGQKMITLTAPGAINEYVYTEGEPSAVTDMNGNVTAGVLKHPITISDRYGNEKAYLELLVAEGCTNYEGSYPSTSYASQAGQMADGWEFDGTAWGMGYMSGGSYYVNEVGNKVLMSAGMYTVDVKQVAPGAYRFSCPEFSYTAAGPDYNPDGNADCTFRTGQWYYITSIPVTLSKGLKMVFHKSGETAELVTSKAVSIERGTFGSLPNADSGLAFSTPGTSCINTKHRE